MLDTCFLDFLRFAFWSQEGHSYDLFTASVSLGQSCAFEESLWTVNMAELRQYQSRRRVGHHFCCDGFH